MTTFKIGDRVTIVRPLLLGRRVLCSGDIGKTFTVREITGEGPDTLLRGGDFLGKYADRCELVKPKVRVKAGSRPSFRYEDQGT